MNWSIGFRQKDLYSRQDIIRLNRFFCGNTPININIEEISYLHLDTSFSSIDHISSTFDTDL